MNGNLGGLLGSLPTYVGETGNRISPPSGQLDGTSAGGAVNGGSIGLNIAGTIGAAAVAAGGAITQGTNIANEQKAIKFLENLGKIKVDLIRKIDDSTEAFLKEIGKYWGSPRSKEFFLKQYIPSIKRLMEATQNAFDKIADEFNITIKRDLAEKNALWTYRKLALASIRVGLNLFAISDSLGDRGVGIISEPAKATLVELAKTHDKIIQEAITNLKQAARDTGLVGIKKKEAIMSAINSIEKALIEFFNTANAQTKKKIEESINTEAIQDNVAGTLTDLATKVDSFFDASSLWG